MKKTLDDEILDLLSSSDRSLTISQIATVLHHARYTIARHLDTLLLTGMVSMRQHGSKKKFFIRKYLPSPSILTILPYIQIILNRNFSIRWLNEPFLHITKTTMEELIGLKFEILETYFDGIRSIAEIIKLIHVGESRVIEEVLTIGGKPLIYRFVCTHISVNTDQTLIILTGEDITTQKELEQEIRNNETRFTTLVNNIPGIVYRLNIRTKQFEYYNDQFRKITGNIPEPISPGNFSPLIPLIIPEDRDKWSSVLQSSLTTRDPYEVEYRIRHINGNILHVLERGQPVYDESDYPVYIDGIIFDISEIKRLEQALQISEQNYRILAESSPDMIYVIGKDDRILFVNSIAANFLHLPAHKILGKPRVQFFPPDIGSSQYETILLVFKTGESLRSESVVLLHNQEIWQDTHLVPLFDEHGEVYAVLGISRDSTLRKKAEKALEESMAKYSMLVENIPEKIFVKDTSLTYVSCNKNYARDLDIISDEIAGKNDFDFYSRDLAEKYRADDLAVIESGNLKTIEERYVSNKKESWVSTIKTPIRNDAGEILGILGIFRDITQSKKTEEELREINELFLLFMHHSPIYAYIKEVTPTESRVLQASDNFEQIIGISGRDMIGKTMVELFPAEFAAKINIDDWSVVVKGEVLKLREDLNGRNYFTIKFPVAMRGKTYLAGYTIDITDQKRNEQALQELTEELKMYQTELEAQNEKLAEDLREHQTELEIQNEELKKTHRDLEESRDKFIELYDFAPVGYFTLTDKAIIAEVNLTGAAMLGIVRQYLIQNRFRKFVIPSDHHQWDQFFLSILRQGGKQTCVLQIKRIDETVFFASIEGVLITRRDGSCQVRFVMSDISEQKWAEEMLKENETKIRNI